VASIVRRLEGVKSQHNLAKIFIRVQRRLSPSPRRTGSSNKGSSQSVAIADLLERAANLQLNHPALAARGQATIRDYSQSG